MAHKVGRIIYVIVQFVAFAFVLIGTPIDMFRRKNVDRFGNTNCLTLWGDKTKCYSTKYNVKPKVMFFECNGRLKRWHAAEAFAIISIIVLGLAFVSGLVSLCCLNCLRFVCLLLNLVAVATVIVVVALMADAYNKSVNNINADPFCWKLKYTYKFGAGFGLYVVGWALNLLNIISLLVDC